MARGTKNTTPQTRGTNMLHDAGYQFGLGAVHAIQQQLPNWNLGTTASTGGTGGKKRGGRSPKNPTT
jgi:hypothetical protein